MKKLYGYIRVSTTKQGEHGVSLQEQTEAINRYAEKNSVSIVQWFEEQKTAAKRGRPIFSAMMRLLRAGKADGVVIHKIDRSARNLRDWADLGELIDAGIDVHFANEPLDLRSRGGRLSADILAVVAADFIRNNREETRKGFYGRLKQGLYPLNAPVGYLDQGGGKAKIVDPVRGPLVRFAFERYATGDASLHSVLDELHSRGFRNRRGNQFSLGGLVRILRNPFFTGVIKLRNGESFTGIHEPLISTATFNRVQDVFAGKRPRRIQVHAYRYRRLFKCATCERSLIASRHKGRVYYRCQTAACPTTCIREDLIDLRVRETLGSISVTPAIADECLSAIRVEVGSRELLIEASKKQITGTIGSIETRMLRLTDVYLAGEIDKEAYLERRAALLMDLQASRERLSAIGGQATTELAAIQKCLELLKAPERLYELGSESEKRQILTVLTSNRTVLEKTIVISVAEPFLFMAASHEAESCAPTGVRPRTFLRLANEIVDWFETEKEEVAELMKKLFPENPNDFEAAA
jgi:site-specific DNA recombinase